MQFLDREVRGGLFLVLGAVLTGIALLRLNRTVINALLPRGNARVVDLLYQQRHLKRGPKIVAIGGGTGLSILLSGLKRHTGNLTAIVTVADDGGSSGRLRRELAILPPGDFRQCIAALADVEPLMGALLQYRFREGSGLEGHNLGNLLIAAMADLTGSFERGLAGDEPHPGRAGPDPALDAGGRGAGRRADATSRRCTASRTCTQDHASGGASVAGRAPIERVFLAPANAVGCPEAVQAILDADIVVVGPGSLYTSVLPNLLVKDIARALAASAAYKVFVCNVATEPGETDHYRAEDFLAAVRRHVAGELFDAAHHEHAAGRGAAAVLAQRRGGGRVAADLRRRDHHRRRGRCRTTPCGTIRPSSPAPSSAPGAATRAPRAPPRRQSACAWPESLRLKAHGRDETLSLRFNSTIGTNCARLAAMDTTATLASAARLPRRRLCLLRLSRRCPL